MERILFRNEGWIGYLAASRAAHFICFFIQYWDVRSSVFLILQGEKWPFSVAPWLVNDRSLRQNYYHRHRHLLCGFDIHADLHHHRHHHHRCCLSVHPRHPLLQGI